MGIKETDNSTWKIVPGTKEVFKIYQIQLAKNNNSSSGPLAYFTFEKCCFANLA